ncbi:MAG: EAL domain-containing protein [Spirochaetales bacterium]|nr:EAL domain-containing protein [Spirochaetales bacterium]
MSRIRSSIDSSPELQSFVPFFQPQYDYETGKIIGAEVLARHIRRDGEIEGPSAFIQTFEKNGFIYEMDRHIWDQACMHLSRWKQSDYPIGCLSVNVSRLDLYHDDMADYLKGLFDKYGLERDSIHLEITETAFSENPEQLIRVLEMLRTEGFIIEMDDFGSGYSSLCLLKDMPVEVLKMDSGFLSATDRSHRSGSIITSIIQMAHAIDMHVIAEGVETKSQADFLKSVGCLKMQGYYFCRPMDAVTLEALLEKEAGQPYGGEEKEREVPNVIDFFDIDSQSTLVFNSYVGGAAILSRGSNGKVAAIRINDKFFEIIGVGREDYAKRQYDLVSGMTEETASDFIRALDNSARSGEETSCMTCCPDIDGTGREFWGYNKIRFLARKRECRLFYLSIEDVTDKVRLLESNRQLMKSIEDREDIFMHAAEQVNMFFWKYNIAEKAIYPCFRCQMVLGLPQRLNNYPESAIEMCIFPEGDRYREVMSKVDSGEDIDEIMLLTSERLPFRVRYTVERDSEGNPTVAYATAIPVVS